MEALKRSMQSGMVSLYVITMILFNNFAIFKATENCACSPLSMFEFLGSSNEGTSSAQGRDGLPVQDWQLWGEEIKLCLSFNCNFQSIPCNIIDMLPICIFRLQLLFKEGWTQMLPCKKGGWLHRGELFTVNFHIQFIRCIWSLPISRYTVKSSVLFPLLGRWPDRLPVRDKPFWGSVSVVLHFLQILTCRHFWLLLYYTTSISTLLYAFY